jgi:hypothetical protein
MPLYELTEQAFLPLGESTFSDLNIRERGDLQRLLRAQIGVLDESLYIISEEFGDWEDSNRRIDLLAIDKDAHLVVIELKRTVDGGHMELQAIRYASMVSAMTLERAVAVHADYLASIGEPANEAQDRILQFLGWDEPNEEEFAQDVRILLVSMDFSKELTTAVLWLRDHDIDIRCIRLKPYADGKRRLVDVQQIIPLPEAASYQIQLREKEQAGREKRAERYDIRQHFWEGLVAIAQKHKTRHGNLKPGSYHWLGASSGIRGLGFNFVVAQEYAVAELYIDRGNAKENKDIFDRLMAEKESIESRFGGPLTWERLDAKRASRVKQVVNVGGYRSPESDWPAIQEQMVATMTRLESALRTNLDTLNL